MRIAVLCVLVSFLFGCESDPCGSVVCGEGSVCSPTDALCHCGGEAGPVCGSGESCVADDGACAPVLPEPICGAGSRWEAGNTAFVEATDAWGLAGVEGVRLTVTDVDGDGLADLEVRRGAQGIEDFATPAGRHTWLLRNTGGRFEDVTESSGILTRRFGDGGRPVTVVAWGDVDNDGDLDVYTGLATEEVSEVGFEASEILLNDGSGRFTLTAEDNGIRRDGIGDLPAGASFTDVDRDGFLDLWVPQHNTASGALNQDLLFRGDGTGRFTDATDAFGLTDRSWSNLDDVDAGLGHTRAWSAAACDLNDDGWPELLVGSYGRSPNHLWQARPSGGAVSYENRSVASGYAYDGNMVWQDNHFARCYCQANRTAEDCADVPAPLFTCDQQNWNHETDRRPFRLGGNSGATICGDLDNDGDLDLFTTEIRHAWAGSGADGSEVLVNDGAADPVFARPGDEALGLAIEHDDLLWDEGHMTAAIFDFDLDGRPDIYVGGSDYAGNRGLLYQQADTLAFREVPPSLGIDHNRSHGVAVADFDRDGDLDVIVGHSRARCDATQPNDCYPTSQVRFFENRIADAGNFVALRLTGAAGTNRAAIGARVRVTAGGVTQTQEVTAGHGHYGAQNDLELTFGLGAACEAEVEVRWPDATGTTQRFTLPGGHRYVLEQGGYPAAR
jgi:hypothetical protein